MADLFICLLFIVFLTIPFSIALILRFNAIDRKNGLRQLNAQPIGEKISSIDCGDWSFSDERKFMESLFVGRFNFFLLFFSLFMTAGFANTLNENRSLVFFTGTFVLFLFWLVLYRGYKKHDRNMKIMFNEMENHPAAQIQKIMKLEGFRPRYTVSKLMGIYIPWLCILVLLTIGIFIHLNILV